MVGEDHCKTENTAYSSMRPFSVKSASSALVFLSGRWKGVSRATFMSMC